MQPKKPTSVTHAKKTWGPALTRIAKKSLSISPEDVATYTPREIDVMIAEAMISGCLSQEQIAEHIKRSRGLVSRALKDNLACAWISTQVRKHIAFRLGNVDVALYAKCLEGNVRAMEVFYKQFDRIVDRSVHVHAHLSGFDPTQLSEDDLDKIIASKMRGREAKYETIDAATSTGQPGGVKSPKGSATASKSTTPPEGGSTSAKNVER